MLYAQQLKAWFESHQRGAKLKKNGEMGEQLYLLLSTLISSKIIDYLVSEVPLGCLVHLPQTDMSILKL